VMYRRECREAVAEGASSCILNVTLFRPRKNTDPTGSGWNRSTRTLPKAESNLENVVRCGCSNRWCGLHNLSGLLLQASHHIAPGRAIIDRGGLAANGPLHSSSLTPAVLDLHRSSRAFAYTLSSPNRGVCPWRQALNASGCAAPDQPPNAHPASVRAPQHGSHHSCGQYRHRLRDLLGVAYTRKLTTAISTKKGYDENDTT
jgi:hypothetical protein